MGRYDDCRRPDPSEIRKTRVMAVPLTEVSAKVRSGGPVDDEADRDLDHWAGVVPLVTRRGPVEPAADLPAGIPTPPYL